MLKLKVIYKILKRKFNIMKYTKYIVFGLIGLAVLMLIGSYNGLASKAQMVDSSWAQVQTQYQRRMDLIPNLVSTVKAEANFEKSTLTDVINARANATKITLDSSVTNDPQKFAQMQQAQGQLSQALSKLMMVSEQYPNLKTNQQFAQLMDSLEGSENRIAYARDNYNKTVMDYNTSIVTFPSVIMARLMGYNKKEYFQADAAASSAPKVDFN